MENYYSVCPRNCFGSCRLRVQVEDGRVVRVAPGGAAPGRMICAKGSCYPRYLSSPDRLLRPLIRVGERGTGDFAPISWDHALQEITRRLTELKAGGGPESMLRLEGSGTLGIAHHAQEHFWSAFGGCSVTYGDLCDPAAQEVLRLCLGSVKMNAPQDIENASLIVLWGKNPRATHPQIMPSLQKALQNGARMVTIDPRRSESASGSALCIQPLPGTDAMLAYLLARKLLDEDLVDWDFVGRHVHDAGGYIGELRDSVDVDRSARNAGVPLSQIDDFMNLMRESRDIAILCGSGLQRYANGGRTIHAILGFAVLLGALGRPGRGFYYNDKQAPELRWPYESSCSGGVRHACAHIGSLGMPFPNKQRIKGAWVSRTNPLVSYPDRNGVEAFLRGLAFVVVTDIFMTETAKYADIVLPGASLFEYADIVRGYGHSYIQYQAPIVEPMGDSASDLEITRRLMRAFGYPLGPLARSDGEILQRVLDASGIPASLEELARHPYLFPGYQEIAFSDGVFGTPSGKIELLPRKMEEKWGFLPRPGLPEQVEGVGDHGSLQLISSHSGRRINSQFSGIPELELSPVLSVHPDDAASRGIVGGKQVEISNAFGSLCCPVQVTPEIRPGVVHVVFGTWDEASGVTVNRLTGGGPTDLGYGTAFHGSRVFLRPLHTDGSRPQ